MNSYYHGSSNGEIDLLMPTKISTPLDQKEERLRCTFDKWLAAVFALDWHDEIARLDWNKVNWEREKIFLILDKEKVKDKSWYIYTLPKYIEPINHNSFEYYYLTPQKPTEKIYIQSLFEYISQNNIKIRYKNI